jgi:hypothetical protein
MDYRCFTIVPQYSVYKPLISFYSVLHEPSRRNCLWWMTPLILSTAIAFTSLDKRSNCFVIGIPSKERKTNKSCPVVAFGTYPINISVSRKFWVVVNLLKALISFGIVPLNIPSRFFYGTCCYITHRLQIVRTCVWHFINILPIDVKVTSSDVANEVCNCETRKYR